MILDRARRNVPLVVSLALLVLLVFWSQLFFGVELPHQDSSPHGLFQALLGQLAQNGIVQCVVSMLATLGLATLFYFINNKHQFIQAREHLIVINFILLFAAFPQLQHNIDVHVCVFFILLSLNSLFSTYRLEYAFSHIFFTAFYVSLASLFYTLSIYILVPCLIGLMLLKSFRWRDMIVFLIACLCPYYIASLVCYFSLGSWRVPLDLLLAYTSVDQLHLSLPSLNIFSYVFILYVALLIVVEIVNAVRFRAGGVKQKTVVVNAVFGWILFVSLLVSVFYLPQNNSLLLLLSIPSTVMITNFFAFMKKDLWANSCVAVLVLLALLSAFTSGDMISLLGR